jgi:hypothetical protein
MSKQISYSTVDEFIGSLEESGVIYRKEQLPLEARRLCGQVSGLFDRIELCLKNIKAELDPYSGFERPSRGWAHSAFRESMRIIELTIDALCADYGLHIPRRNATGVRKSIAIFLLESAEEVAPHAAGELRKRIKNTRHTEETRRGRHAMGNTTGTKPPADDIAWLRRRVKYPGSDIPYDDLRHEIEHAMHLARRIYHSFLNLAEPD